MSGFSERMRSLFGRSAAIASSGSEKSPPAAVEPSRRDARAAPGSAGDVVAELLRKVVELSEGRVGPEQIDPEASILDHGYVDSLSSVSLLGFIEERYGVEIPETELVGRANSLAGLAEYVERERSR